MSEKIDKVFDLLEKVYIELQETKKEVKETKNRVSNIEDDVKDIKNSQVRMENKFDEKIKALFDANKANEERISNLINLPNRVEHLETDVTLLKKIVSNK